MPSSPPSQPPFETERRLRALDHPLPAGMRDHLPRATRVERVLAATLMDVFELHAYEAVQAPVFEYADVLERGLGSLEPQEVLRFVEPESGEVVALRPDVTPQLARIVASRLWQEPPPARLCYHGSVLRRPQARARKNRQIPQAGIELVGSGGLDGDLEVLRVVVGATRAAGLSEFVLDLGHAGIAQALLADVPRARRPALVDALSRRDELELSAACNAAGLVGREREALLELPRLHGDGGPAHWQRVRTTLAETRAADAAEELAALTARVLDAQLAPSLVVDLGEVRAFEYYTGMTFQLLAAGPGRPVAAGGRYDKLLGRFGAPRPAAGGAIDLDNLRWALERAGRLPAPSVRVLVRCAPGEEPRRDQLLELLRASRVACAAAPEGDAVAHARAWRYTHLLELGTAESTPRLRSLVGEELDEPVLAQGLDALGREVAARVRAELASG